MDHSVTLSIIVKCFRLAIRIDVDEKQNSKKENNSQVDVRLANWRIWKKPLKKKTKHDIEFVPYWMAILKDFYLRNNVTRFRLSH